MDPAVDLEWVIRLGHDLQDAGCSQEVRRLGRTLLAGATRWPPGIRPSEQRARWAVNNLIKRIKRVAFGFSRFRNYQIRTLLFVGRPNWSLLATTTPR